MSAGIEIDVINHLAGIEPDSAVAALRAQKPDLIRFAQGSYDALLEPLNPVGLSLIERHSVAFRVGVLTGFDSVMSWHRDRLVALGEHAESIAAIHAFPSEMILAERLRALLRHTDLVTSSPGSAEADDISVLKAAGLTPAAIVTLGQLVGFLGYQIRVITAARALAEGQS